MGIDGAMQQPPLVEKRAERPEFSCPGEFRAQGRRRQVRADRPAEDRRPAWHRKTETLHPMQVHLSLGLYACRPGGQCGGKLFETFWPYLAQHGIDLGGEQRLLPAPVRCPRRNQPKSRRRRGIVQPWWRKFEEKAEPVLQPVAGRSQGRQIEPRAGPAAAQDNDMDMIAGPVSMPSCSPRDAVHGQTEPVEGERDNLPPGRPGEPPPARRRERKVEYRPRRRARPRIKSRLQQVLTGSGDHGAADRLAARLTAVFQRRAGTSMVFQDRSHQRAARLSRSAMMAAAISPPSARASCPPARAATIPFTACPSRPMR